MRARVLFFGLLKDVVGRSAEERDFADGADLRAVFDTYAADYPRIREMASSIVMARNQEFAPLDTVLRDGDEIAFLPPVSGGVCCDPLSLTDPQGHYFAITRHAIDTKSVIARILTG